MLSTGLIHDFCNIMTGFVSISETLEAESKGNEPVRNSSNLIRKTAFDAGQLAHRVRRLYQEVPGEKNYHDLNELVSSLSALLEKLLSRRITIQLLLATGQLAIYADSVELHRVIVALVLDAIRSIRETGRITIRTSLHRSTNAISPQPSKRLPQPPVICLSIESPGTEVFKSSDRSLTELLLSKDSNVSVFQAQKFAEKHDAALTFDSGETSSTIHIWLPLANLDEPQENAP